MKQVSVRRKLSHGSLVLSLNLIVIPQQPRLRLMALTRAKLSGGMLPINA